jgi:hypothetical protein
MCSAHRQLLARAGLLSEQVAYISMLPHLPYISPTERREWERVAASLKGRRDTARHETCTPSHLVAHGCQPLYPSMATDAWQGLPDDLCKHVAQRCYLLHHRDVVPLLRLTCRDWKDSIDRCLETLEVDGRKNVFLATPMPYVKHVTVNKSLSVDLVTVLSRMPQLKTLVLRDVWCSDEAFEAFPLLNQLKSLSVVNVEALTDEQAPAMLKGLPQLTHCEFVHCSSIGRGTLEALSQLPALQSLVFNGCYQVSDWGLQAFATGCAPLRRLHMIGWCDVTPPGLARLAAALPGLTDLQKLRSARELDAVLDGAAPPQYPGVRVRH